MTSTPIVSKHAEKRTKTRLGISKKLADKNAKKAMEFGLTHAETKNGLKRYLDSLYLSYGIANNMRVYHHHVYIFKGVKLITILPLPQKFEKLADELQRNKKAAMEGVCNEA